MYWYIYVILMCIFGLHGHWTELDTKLKKYIRFEKINVLLTLPGEMLNAQRWYQNDICLILKNG